MDIAANLASLRARIAAHAPAGQDVTLVAISKTQSIEAIHIALAAGQRDFGENRVQEAQAKFAALRHTHADLHLHLVGGLQTNKADDAVRLFDTIASLDRPRLADAIARAADRAGRLPKLLIQVNVGDEPQKSGVARALADDFIRDCQARFGPALQGLMGVPPAGAPALPHFLYLAQRAKAHGLKTLSMGMSDDFEEAVEAGATQVRIGSALFGSRKARGSAPGPR